MTNKKYSKEDIAAVFKTHYAEQSLIVMGMDKELRSGYTETALVKIKDRILNKTDIENWILSIPRFRDLFIYENLDQPVRVRLKKIDPPIEFVDAHNWDELQILDWLETQHMSFNIQQAPLFKIFVFNANNSQYLTCCYHHLLFDAISIQYAFASLLAGTKLSEQEWLPKLNIESDIKTSEVSFHLQNFVPAALNEDNKFLYENLELPDLSYKEFMVKWAEFLFLATGEEQICIGEVFNLRNSEFIAQAAIGYYVQTWPIILKSSSNINEDLDNQRSKILSINDKPVQNFYQSGLFDHCWVLEPELKSDFNAIFRSRPHYLLSIVIQTHEKGLSLSFVWNLNKIIPEAAKEIVNSFKNFLNGQNDIKVLTPTNYTLKPITEIWKEKLRSNPNKIAVSDSLGNKLTYQQLEGLSDSLASVMNVRVQEPVGIRTSNSALLIVAMLAILKKRAIYVPLDPEISNERLNYILKDAGIETIVSDLEGLPGKNMLHPLQENVSDVPQQTLKPELDEICYLIYTSGTTGQPKGCAVTHSNLCNLFLGTALNFDLRNDDRWILAHSYGFDFSTWEIWGALLNAAFLYIPERMEVKDSFKFYDLLLREDINILNQTPKSFDNLMLVGESKSKLNKLKYLIFGGDKLNIQKISDWQTKNTKVKVINMYGITETTVHVTFKEVGFDKYSNIGNPLPGYGLTLHNKKGIGVPDGFIGEFYVDGDGVCKGYFQKEEHTTEKFDFKKIPTYKSGDLGWRMNHDFYYLGRNDRQIKIRGYRIELGEIEFLLHKEFGYLFRVLFIDNKIIVAFHTCPNEIERSMCTALLQDYANPAQFIRLSVLPLNVNGKTDEKELETIYRMGQITAPEEANTLTPYLNKILGNNISTEKSFVENGGDSISAIRLVNALRKDHLNLSVQDLFTAASLSGLTFQKLINKSIETDWRKDPLIKTYNNENQSGVVGIFPLSEAQTGILYDSLAGSSEVYMVQLTYEFGAEISTEQLRNSYLNVLQALPALQLQIRKHEETYVWVLPKEPVFEIEIISEFNEINSLLEEDFKMSFDFAKNLIRLSIVEKETGEKLLIWTHHHLLMDGWSLGLFSKLLLKSLKGETIELRDSYLDFLYSFKDKKNSNEAYWKSRLENCSKDPLIPYLTVGKKTEEYGEILVEIAEIPLWKKLPELGLTQHNFVFSAWLAFVNSAFKNNELNIGNVISLREGNLDEEVGMLIQTLPFYIANDNDESFSNFATRVKNQLIEDNRNKEFSYNALEGINLNLDHIFVFENYPIDETVSVNSAISIGKFKERTAAKWTLICYPTQNGIKVRTLFQGNFYKTEYVAKILNRFSEFIKNLVWEESISSSINSISKWQSIYGKEKFLSQAENLFCHFTTNSGFKIINDKSEFSQMDIQSETERITTKLLELGLSKNEAVGIDLKSVSNFVIAVMSIWKLNAVPCSVDYRYPEQRKSFIWKNASCRFVLVEKEGELYIESLEHSKTEQPKNASFILHTSGSTGIPKGVIQTKDCLIHLANWTATELGLTKEDKILALSSFGFDASYHEIILWLSLGATLVEIPYESRQDIQEIRNCIIDKQISLAWIPARLLNSILDIDPNYFDECHSLKQLVTTGESLIIGDALKNWVANKNIRLFNFYGPTETHVVTAKIVDKHNITKIPDIGQPINNATICLLDAKGNSVPKGLIGEIWISGPYLAEGYLNDPELSKQKFILKNGCRWYKSGDLGWIDENGYIEYLGRLDDQIKIRGFRIEPFEVESLLHNVEGIEQVAIAVDKNEDIKLIAFWTGKKMSDNEFRKASAKILPEFMIPEIQVHLDYLPRNINGKIDRNLLIENYYTNAEKTFTNLPDSKASQCWEAILGHKNFRKNAQFQSLGGNSIKIMRMQAWLEKNYGISISVKELILNQTISELNELIAEKEKETTFALPDSFPLNPLQRDILLAEIGNYSFVESPYLLSFSCAIPEKFNPNEIDKAIDFAIDINPHLTYVIDNELSQREWKKCLVFREYIKTPLDADSLKKGEPLLRIFHKDGNLMVQWHHILLDAVGISMFMQAFYFALIGEQKLVKRNYKVLLNQESIRNIAKTESSSKACEVYERILSNNEKEAIEQIAKNFELSLQEFSLLLSHSIFGNESFVAYTDNTHQCGIPGMFTFLNCSHFSKSGNIKSSLHKNSETKNMVSVVTNFMLAPELPLSDINIKSNGIKSCKYPYEFQIEVFDDKIRLQFICEADNPLSANKAKQLFTNIDKLLDEKSFDSLFDEKTKKIHFEDFDF
jgi:amino acid adenylation domain-containing protein